MSSSQDPITPTRFDTAPPPAAQTDDAASDPVASGERPAWVVPGLIGLAVLAVLVVFVLPALVQPPEPAPVSIAAEQADKPASRAAPAAAEPPQAEGASPWQDAQAAKLRKEAQDVLEALLDIQFDLQERGAEQWAAEVYATAAGIAQQGDAQYKERAFEEARKLYEEALAAFTALQASLPERVDQEVSKATQAIEDLEEDSLAASLALLALMEPENPALPELSQRQTLLPALQAQFSTAGEAEASGDLATAESALREATNIDNLHQRAASELERVSAAHLDQRFNRAMSEGYAALDSGQLSAARSKFQAAAKLRPGSGEASAALIEVAAASTAAKLSSLQGKGTRSESGEDWQAAVDSYESALKLDANVLFAVEGLARSKPRAELDADLRKVIDEPARLSDIAVAQDSAELLARARAVQPRGPVLAQQINTLGELLSKANQPIPVVLKSDTETEVIVYKVARLGRFQQRTLELRPGTYTALGTRNGFRDVRRSFTLSHDSSPPEVSIICTEQI